MSEINYSYSVGGQPASSTPKPTAQPVQPAVPEDDSLWSFTGVELVRVNGELTLLIDRISGKRLMVRPEVAVTLTHCETFRTLREHANYLVTVLPELGGQAEPVIPVLAQIRDAGLMRSAEEMVAQLTAETDGKPITPVRVFIITCDRPAAVERLIASMESASGLDMPESYWLIDDSRSTDNIAANKALVEACNERGKLTFTYFGLDERASLIDHLITQVPGAADAVRFLLDRAEWSDLPTYGISRSLALLLSVGCRAVVLDDDVVCEAVRSPLPPTGVHFGSVRNREAVFYDSREALLSNTRKLPDNPITLAARQLGQGLSNGLKSLLHGELPATALTSANGAFMGTLSPNSPILKTQCSTWGDPGTGNGHWVIGLGPESIGRLLDVPGGLVETIEARSSWVGQTGPAFTKHGVMSQLTGYDASHLLPPFMPALRGEDHLFAYMLTTLHPDSLVLNHDWAVTHLPLEERGQRSLRAAIASGGGIGLLTRWLGENVDLSEGIAPATRLQRIAQSLRELTELGDRDLMNFGRIELAKSHAAQLEAYQNHLTQSSSLGSSNWQQYLERGYNEIFGALQKEPDLNQLLSAQLNDQVAGLASIRRGGTRFANALASWPQIWNAAALFKLQ